MIQVQSCCFARLIKPIVFYFFALSLLSSLWLIGTLRSNDADGNENVKKTEGLMSKTTTLHVHHAFFVHFFPVFSLHNFDVKMSNFAF